MNPHLAVPLLQGVITTDELVDQIRENADIVVNPEGVYAVEFYADPFIRTKTDLFPKITFDLPVPLLDTVTSLPITVFPDATISRAIFSGDEMFFILNSDLEEDIRVRIEIPELQRDGETFSFEYTIPFDGSSPSSLTTPRIDLSGYELDAGNGLVSLRYDARKVDGSRVQLPLSFVRVNAFDFAYLEGKIGKITVPTDLQSIEIDIEDTLVDGTYHFEDPKIHFDLHNSFGVPIGVRVKSLYLVTDQGEQREIVSPLFDQIFLLNYPQLDQVGLTVSDRITFDKTNSNILDLITAEINEIVYNLDIITNPDDEIDEFFLTDSSKAVLDATLNLSFAAIVEEVSASRTAVVFLEDIDTLSEGRVKVFVDNGMPLSFQPKLLFFRASGNNLPLDVEDNRVVASAITDDLGNVIGSRSTAIYYTLNRMQIRDISLMDSVRATLTIQSPQGGLDPAIIKPGQFLEFGVGIEAKLR